MLTEDQEQEGTCPLCGGTGGWPHPLRPGGRETCKPCRGTGLYPAPPEGNRTDQGSPLH